jgi:hypothetical protein
VEVFRQSGGRRGSDVRGPFNDFGVDPPAQSGGCNGELAISCEHLTQRRGHEAMLAIEEAERTPSDFDWVDSLSADCRRSSKKPPEPDHADSFATYKRSQSSALTSRLTDRTTRSTSSMVVVCQRRRVLPSSCTSWK